MLSSVREIHKTSMQVKSEQTSSVKSDLSSDADILYPCFKKCFRQMFWMKSCRQRKILRFSTLFSRTCSPMDWEITNYSGVDRARYTSLKQVNSQACPCLILLNHTNSHGEILGACRTIADLCIRIGGRAEDLPKVAELRKAGLDRIPIHNNHLVLCMFLPSDIITPEQVIADCGNDPSKKTTLDELLRLALTAGLAKRTNALEIWNRGVKYMVT